MTDRALEKLVRVIRDASWKYGDGYCDTRGLSEAKHVAKAIIMAITDEERDIARTIREHVLKEVYSVAHRQD